MLVARLALGRGWLWTLWLRSAVHERALVEPSSDRTDERSKRLQEAKPHDRSRRDDSTERGRYCRPTCEAFGRRDRPDVRQHLCAAIASRAGGGVVLPRASGAAAAVRSSDVPDEP